MAGIIVGIFILFILGLFCPNREEDPHSEDLFLYLEKWDVEKDRDETDETQSFE